MGVEDDSEAQYIRELQAPEGDLSHGIVAGGCVRNPETVPQWFRIPPEEITAVVFDAIEEKALELAAGVMNYGYELVFITTSLSELKDRLKRSPQIIVFGTGHAISTERAQIHELLRKARLQASCQLLLVGTAESLDAFLKEIPPLLAVDLGLHDPTFCDKLVLDGGDIMDAARAAMEKFANRRAKAIEDHGIADDFRI